MMPYEERALPGALVGIAAGMQDRYWELAEVLYPFISGDGEPPTDRELSAGRTRRLPPAPVRGRACWPRWSAYADEIDLDYEQFLIDYRSAEARQRVAADTDIGLRGRLHRDTGDGRQRCATRGLGELRVVRRVPDVGARRFDGSPLTADATHGRRRLCRRPGRWHARPAQPVRRAAAAVVLRLRVRPPRHAARTHRGLLSSA